MRIATAHVHVPASADRLFAYLADVGNLPAWSTEFVHGHERDGDVVRATTGMGPATLRVRPDRATGVVDIEVTPDGGPPVLFPARVVGLPDGSSVFQLTLVQPPDRPEAALEGDLASLQRELETLRRTFAT